MKLKSKIYDLLKPVALIYLPSIATLYFAVATIWGIPGTQNVIGTISAIGAFLGTVLGLSSRNYSANGDGVMVVDEDGLKRLAMPQVTASDIAAKKTITLKIQSDAASSGTKDA